jgi:hypothetical protein
MKVKTKVSAKIKNPVLATAKTKKHVPPVAEEKKPRVGSLLYRFLRGCGLFIPNVRKEDIKGQPFVEMPKATVVAVAFTQTAFGVCVSNVKANGTTIALPEKELGFDMSQVGGKVMKLPEAAKWAKKAGKLHTLHMKAAKKGTTETGYLIGDLGNQYVGFFRTRDGKFDTLETKALPDGRNANRLFELVK